MSGSSPKDSRLSFRRLRFYYLMVSLPLVAAAFFSTSRFPLWEDLRNILFDYYQRAAPRQYDPDGPVRIIDIDDESLRRGGQWPWPRNQMGAIVDRLVKAHAAVIGFDFLFSEPDHSGFTQKLGTMPQSRVVGQLEQELSQQQTLDQLFAHSINGNPVVLASVLNNAKTAITTLPNKSGFVTAGDDPTKFVTQFPSGIAPLPNLAEAAAGLGAINWLPDHDQTVRRVPLIMSLGGTLVPNMALEMLRVLQNASTYVVKASNANGERAFGVETGVVAIKVGQVVIPTQARGDMRIRFTRPEESRYLPAWQLFADESAAAGLEGKIVLVGTSAAALNDIIATPLSAAMPGVEVLAQLIEQILSGETLVRPDYAEGLELSAGLILSICFILGLPRISALVAAVAGGAAAAGIAAASWLAFTRYGLLFDPLFPTIWSGAVFLTGVYALYGIKRRQEQEVRHVFGRFVSPTIVARLAEHPERLKLGGDQRELTLMFCDLRAFTTLSEGLTAHDLTRFLNDYLTPMTDIILNHAGTIDKYMGDAIMAFWNAPLDDPGHARNSARAALRMRACLSGLNAEWAAHPQTYGKVLPLVKFGIGLNTGEACVGNLGSIRRFDYSVIGDEVNVTSRLESASKYFGVDIVASEATRAEAPDLAWLKIDDVVLKGKSRPVAVYALAGDDDYARSREFQDLSRAHAAMIEACAARDFPAAIELAWQASAAAPTEIVGLYDFKRMRFAEYSSQMLEASWKPLTVLQDK